MNETERSEDAHVGVTTRVRTTEQAISDLLGRAERHPLGVEFLKHGALDSVAATYGVHAFVVDAARDALRSNRVDAPLVQTTGVAVPSPLG